MTKFECNLKKAKIGLDMGSTSDGTLVQMPATKTPQTIMFNDVSAKLVIENNKVMFGTQVVNVTPAAIF